MMAQFLFLYLSAYLLLLGHYKFLEKRGYISFIFLSPAIIIIFDM